MTTPNSVELVHAFGPALHQEWQELVTRSVSTLPFHQPAFVDAAIRMGAGETTPLLFLVRDREGGTLRGALALGEQRSRIGPLTLPVVGPLSPRRTDITSILAAEADAPWVEAAIGARLEQCRRAGRRFNIVGSSFEPSFHEQLPSPWIRRRPQVVRTADLDGASTWEDVILDGHQRREIRRSERMLERDRPHAVHWARDARDIAPALAAFVDLHRVQQAQRGRSSAFASTAARTGLCQLLEQWVPDGRADLGLMTDASDRPGAGYILFHHGATTLAYRTVFDLALRRYGVGSLMLAAAVDRAIARGSARYGFGWGDEPYKQKWSRVTGEIATTYSPPPAHRHLLFRLLARLGATPSRPGDRTRTARSA